MNPEEYLRLLSREISDSSIRKKIQEELANHLEDQIEAYVLEGESTEVAVEKTIEQMGNPSTVGRQFNKIYRKYFDWKILLYCFCWTMVFKAVALVGVGGGLPQEAINIIRYAGIGLLLLSFVWSAVEKWLDLPLLYAWGNNWNGGAIANSGLLAALGIVMLDVDLKMTFIITVGVLLIIGVERAIIATKKSYS